MYYKFNGFYINQPAFNEKGAHFDETTMLLSICKGLIDLHISNQFLIIEFMLEMLENGEKRNNFQTIKKNENYF